LSKDIGELQKRLIALDSTVTVLADRFDTELKAVKGVSGLDEKDLAPLREEISAAKEAAGGWMSQYDALEEKLRSEVSGFGKLIDDTKATVSGQFNGFKAEVEQNIGEQIKSAIGEKLSGVKATVEELPWYQRWVVWFVVLVIAMTVFSASGAWALLHRVNKKILAAVPGNRLDDLHARLDDNVERHAAAGWNPLKQAKATAAGGYDAAQEAREIADKAIKAALAAAGLGAALAPGLAPVVSTVERGHEAADDLLDKLMARIATLVDAQPKARPEPAAVAPPAPPRAVAPAAPAAPVPANPAA
jgi:hypothetical protein